MAFQHSSETLRALGENNAFDNAIAIRLNFGLFDRIGIGLKYLWNEHDATSFINWTATLKVQLLKEQEVGTIPSVAIGVETLSDRLFSGNSEAEENENPSAFLAISKTFNLPRIHQFSGHLGVGTQRFAFGESPIGLFVGLRKEFQPAFASGDITMNLEFDGAGVKRRDAVYHLKRTSGRARCRDLEHPRRIAVSRRCFVDKRATGRPDR